MTRLNDNDQVGASGIDLERKRNRKYWAFWWVPLVAVLIASLGFDWAFGHDDLASGGYGKARAIFGVAMTVIGLPWVAIAYHRFIDEQEERAILWSSLFGYYLVLGVGLVWTFLAKAGLVPPLDFIILMLVTFVPMFGVFFWLKYR